MEKARDENGMMTVEVVIGLTIYMAFFVLLLNMINVMYLRQKFQMALKTAAIQASRDYRLNKDLAEYEDATNVFFDLEQRNMLYGKGDYPYYPGGDYKKNAKDKIKFLITDFDGKKYSLDHIYSIGLVDGLNGLNLDSSTIDMENGGSVNLTLKYRIRIINLPFFDDAGLDINIEQNASTKLW